MGSDFMQVRLDALQEDLPMLATNLFQTMGAFMEAGFSGEDSLEFAKQTYERVLGEYCL